MSPHLFISRERWLADAIETTRTFIGAERAENEYDLRTASPDSTDYAIAADSAACLELTAATLTVLEMELAEIRRRRELRRMR